LQDIPYFRAIYGQMDNGGREAMLHDLLNRDISKQEFGKKLKRYLPGVTKKRLPSQTVTVKKMGGVTTTYSRRWRSAAEISSETSG
jgi:hypothetical protein